MFGRLWNFAKRHRKKFIFGAVFAGGTYAAWRILLPKLQERMLQSLLKELTDGGLGAGDDREAPEKRRQRFEHKQQVSDKYARRKLLALRQRQNDEFLDEARSSALQEAKDKATKLEAFKALQVECMAKVVSALYTLHLVLLTCRVGFNIVGREVEAAVAAGGVEEEANGKGGAHAEFLEALEHVCSGGFHGIAQALRAATQRCANSIDLAPQTKVTEELLQKFLTDSCREADAELLTQAKAPATLLPDGLEANASEANRVEVKRLLDEARDYLESPQFLQVFQAAMSGAAGALAKGLAAEVPGDGPWPLAKLFGPMTKLAGILLDPEDEASELSGFGCAQRFAEAPEVVQLCEGLYGLKAVEVA